MKRKPLSLEEAEAYSEEAGPAGEGTAWATEGLRLAIERELTARQRECVELYYYQGLTMEEVGKRLGIGKATVCRHLQKSQARLQRVAAYMQIGRRTAKQPK